MKRTYTASIIVVGLLVLSARSIADNLRLPLADEATRVSASSWLSIGFIYSLLSIPQALGPLVGLWLLRQVRPMLASSLCLLMLAAGAVLLLPSSTVGLSVGFGILGLGIGVASVVYKVALTETPSGRSGFVLLNATFGLSAAAALELARRWPSRIVLLVSLAALAATATSLFLLKGRSEHVAPAESAGGARDAGDPPRRLSPASWLLVLALALVGTAEYCAFQWLPTFFSAELRSSLMNLLPATMLCITCGRVVFGLVQLYVRTSRLWWLTLPALLALGGVWMGHAAALCLASFFYGAVSPSGYRDLAEMSGRQRDKAFVIASYSTLLGIALANLVCVWFAGRGVLGLAVVGALFVLGYAAAKAAFAHDSRHRVEGGVDV